VVLCGRREQCGGEAWKHKLTHWTSLVPAANPLPKPYTFLRYLRRDADTDPWYRVQECQPHHRSPIQTSASSAAKERPRIVSSHVDELGHHFDSGFQRLVDEILQHLRSAHENHLKSVQESRARAAIAALAATVTEMRDTRKSQNGGLPKFNESFNFRKRNYIQRINHFASNSRVIYKAAS
jgi:hypothetical protein